MSVVKNYFTIKGPVDPKFFFNRKEEVELFKNLLEVESYDVLISIIAPFRFGKTSLLKKYLSIASKFDKLINIYIPAKTKDDPIEIIRERFLEMIPEAKRVKVENRNNLAAFFKQLNKVLENRDMWAILYIDEFQEIPNILKAYGYMTSWSTEEIFEMFRGITEEFRFGLVVTGSYIGELLDAIAVWNGRFTELKLGAFPREDSIRMLSTLFELSGVKVTDDIIEYIASSVCDHPFYMQLFGHHLVRLRRVNEETIEKVRKIVLYDALKLYRKKLKEIRKLGDESIKILLRIAQGELDIESLSLDDWELIWNLERLGVLYVRDSEVELTDKMFGRFVINVASGRREERILPQYVPEYLVVRDLAYKQNIKEILLSYMSWGPFDIIIHKKITHTAGIGIQVKATSKDEVILSQKEISQMISESMSRELIPILATVFLHRGHAIRYFKIEKSKTRYHFNEGKINITQLISQ